MYSDAAFTSTAHTISQFNSLGPTLDGRMKPDILATGYYVMSAYSSSFVDQLRAQNIQYATTADERMKLWGRLTECGQRCAVHEKSGSSMATPVVAGNALLIREYFMNSSFFVMMCRERHSQFGMCENRQPFEPSGYLTKAIILHSGQEVPHYGDKKIYNLMGGPKPSESDKSDVFSYDRCKRKGICGVSGVQGYGEVNLENVLPLPGDSSHSKGLHLVVFDKLVMTEYETMSLEIDVAASPGGDDYIKATLCWYDPPSVVGWGSSLLIHDVDMIIDGPYIRSDKGTLLNDHNRARRYWGNGVDRGDHKNPNEQIFIRLPQEAEKEDNITYVVYLLCHAFPANRKSLNADGSATMRKVGLQNVAFSITSSAPISTSKFSKVSTISARNKSFNRFPDDKIISAEHDGHLLAESPKLVESTVRNCQPFHEGMIDTHKVNFSNVKLGIHSSIEHGKPEFGRYEHDIATIDSFRLPSHSTKISRLVGVSICLDSPYVAPEDLLPSTFYTAPRRAGVDAYYLTIIVRSPNGSTVQLGGYDWALQKDNFYRRFWPFLWMAPNFDGNENVDMIGEYCSEYFHGKNHDLLASKRNVFAAYRDVTEANLYSNTDECSSENVTWSIEAAYGKKPFGSVVRVTFGGEIKLYFEISANISDASGFTSFQPVSLTNLSKKDRDFTRISLKVLFYFSCMLATGSVVYCILNEAIIKTSHPELNTTVENYRDHRTPLSCKSRAEYYQFSSMDNSVSAFSHQQRRQRDCEFSLSRGISSRKLMADHATKDEVLGLLSGDA